MPHTGHEKIHIRLCLSPKCIFSLGQIMSIIKKVIKMKGGKCLN